MSFPRQFLPAEHLAGAPAPALLFTASEPQCCPADGHEALTHSGIPARKAEHFIPQRLHSIWDRCGDRPGADPSTLPAAPFSSARMVLRTAGLNQRAFSPQSSLQYTPAATFSTDARRRIGRTGHVGTKASEHPYQWNCPDVREPWQAVALRPREDDQLSGFGPVSHDLMVNGRGNGNVHQVVGAFRNE